MAVERNKTFVKIFIRPVIHDKGSVGSTCVSICAHLLAFVHVPGFLPVVLGHRRNAGCGVFLHLVLTGMHILLCY